MTEVLLGQFHPAQEIERVVGFIRKESRDTLHRMGGVVGLSGGIDSAVMAALAVRAFGPQRVLGLILPEHQSDPRSAVLATEVARQFQIRTETHEISSALEAFGAYQQQDAVLRKIRPDFGPGWRFNLSLPQDVLERDRIGIYTLNVESPQGVRGSHRISWAQFRALVAAANVKQRVRMIYLYNAAERDNYAVIGTTNRSEMVLGFYCLHGDGAVDLEPIAHLYKSQVIQLGRALGVPPAVIERTPTPDTWSLPVSDAEYYFCMDYPKLDAILAGWEQGLGSGQLATKIGMEEQQVARAFRDFEAKRRGTTRLRMTPPSILSKETSP